MDKSFSIDTLTHVKVALEKLIMKMYDRRGAVFLWLGV